MASPLTVWTSDADGTLRNNSADWDTARAGGGTMLSYGTGQVFTGIALSTTYYVWEGFLDFNTADIPDGATITTVTLSLYGWGSNGTLGWTLQARIFDWGGTLASGDWRPGDPDSAGDCAEYTLVATRNTTGWGSSAYYSFTSETAFLTNVSKTGTTYLLLNDARMLGDAPDAPTEITRVAYYLSDYTGTDRDPKLYIEYSETTALTTTAATASLTAQAGLARRERSLKTQATSGALTAASAALGKQGLVELTTAAAGAGLTAAAAAMLRQRTLTSVAAAAALSAGSATTGRHRPLTAAAAAAALTAQAGLVSRERSLTAQATSGVLTAESALALRSRSLAADAAAAALTAEAATLSRERSAAASAASCALTAQAATLSRERSLAASAASCALTAEAALAGRERSLVTTAATGSLMAASAALGAAPVAAFIGMIVRRVYS